MKLKATKFIGVPLVLNFLGIATAFMFHLAEIGFGWMLSLIAPQFGPSFTVCYFVEPYSVWVIVRAAQRTPQTMGNTVRHISTKQLLLICATLVVLLHGTVYAFDIKSWTWVAIGEAIRLFVLAVVLSNLMESDSSGLTK